MEKYKQKGYQQIEHLSDVGLRIYGESVEELFKNAAVGMFSIMCKIEDISPVEKRKISIYEKNNIDLENLFIIWLENLLYRFEKDEMLFSRFDIKKLNLNKKESLIYAHIFGEKVDFRKHEIIVAIKAPTYHMLKVEKEKNGFWTASVIFDI